MALMKTETLILESSFKDATEILNRIIYWVHLFQSKTKEGLLLKIIPRHLLDDMKKVINRKLVEVVNAPNEVFHELLLESHETVR